MKDEKKYSTIDIANFLEYLRREMYINSVGSINVLALVQDWEKSPKYEKLAIESILTYEQSKEILQCVNSRDYAACFVMAKELSNVGISFDRVKQLTVKAFK